MQKRLGMSNFGKCFSWQLDHLGGVSLQKKFVGTKTYQNFFQTERRLSNPLWVIAGICWTGLSPRRPLPSRPT